MARLFRRFRVQRYSDPSLHEGQWSGPTVHRGVVS
jgi:hypothetical protein